MRANLKKVPKLESEAQFSRWEYFSPAAMARRLEQLPETHRDVAEIRWLQRHVNKDGFLDNRYYLPKGITWGRVFARHGYQRLTTDTRWPTAATRTTTW